MDEVQSSNSGSNEAAVRLTVAWLSNPNTRADAAGTVAFLDEMRAAVSANSGGADEAAAEPAHEPAVSIRKSLASDDHLISLIDGKPYKTLRRHLSRHGMTPEDYRRRYGLKSDYPMVARNYSEHRRAMAKQIGLGSKGRAARKAVSDGEAAPTPAPKRGRRKAGEDKADS